LEHTDSIVHVKARMENGELVEKEIVCASCGGEARKFTGFDRNGAFYVLLGCTECGESLAEFQTNAELETSLVEIWRTVKCYLLQSPKEFKGEFNPTPAMLSRSRPV